MWRREVERERERGGGGEECVRLHAKETEEDTTEQTQDKSALELLMFLHSITTDMYKYARTARSSAFLRHKLWRSKFSFVGFLLLFRSGRLPIAPAVHTPAATLLV